MFKQICTRKKDIGSLTTGLLKKMNMQTAAMKHGIQHEPDAAKLYGEVTVSNVLLSGFVINPSSPYLGTSPDRHIYVRLLPVAIKN